MYLQPSNNPRANLYSRQINVYSSTLNLSNRRPSNPAGFSEDQGLQLRLAAAPGFAAGRLHKARSLDVLSEPLTQLEAGTSPTVGGGHHSLNLNSSEFSLSSSDSESTSSLTGVVLEGRPVATSSGRSSPERSIPARHDSSRSSQSSGSTSSKDSSTVTPRVPSRPKTEEILNRCSTMTRKAAMATKSRLQVYPAESIYSR